ncbi:MAG: alpha-amylase family glycosyl hydrolase [Bacteroidota bacterium]
MKKIVLLTLLSTLLFAQQPTPLSGESARPSEEWVKSGIIYEIYPRSFSKEGTFAGIEQKLPELKKLGVTILWLMPIHPVGEEKRKGTLGSPYSIKDYYGINPEFGTLEDFQRLVKKSQELGFKIIIDLVANHTSWDSKMFKEHPEWFTKDTSGVFIPPVADWSDVVDLNYDRPELRRYMIDMLKYWVRDIGLDGFRCDVAEMVPTDFWNDARAALDSIKPIIMLAEGQYPEHHLKAFDLTYSWNFYHTISPVLNGDKQAMEFDSVLIREAAAYPKGSIRLRFSSNHDENAWDKPDVEKFGPDGARLAAVLVSTFPGAPLLYNGQEAGNNTKLQLFEKVDIDWTKGKPFTQFYTTLYTIRAKNPSLSTGDYQYVKNNASDRVYSFIRTDGKNTVLTILNFSGDKKSVKLELPKIFSSLKFTDPFTGKTVKYKNVESLKLPKFGYKLFVVE